MPDSDVIKVLKEYRQAMDAAEASMVEDMGRRWLQVEAALERDMSLLAYEVEARRQAGQVVTQQMVWKMETYKRLHVQIEEQVALYNKNYALPIIKEAQTSMSMLGIRAANDALSMTYLESLGAIGPMWTHLNVNAVESMVGFAGNGAPLMKLLRRDFGTASDGMMNALVNGMARGLGVGDIAKNMMDGTALGLDRALLIARTEAARAYRTSMTEQYRQSGVVTGFFRLVKKETACMACLMKDGEHFDTEDELTDHPRGKCSVVAAVMGVGKPKWVEGPQYFMTLSPEEQQARMGAGSYSLWKEGRIDLTDLAGLSHSDEWGDAPRVLTLAELRDIVHN